LVVFLALMLFHAALTIDVRELIDDAAPTQGCIGSAKTMLKRVGRGALEPVGGNN
jgi:hypothetical protein